MKRIILLIFMISSISFSQRLSLIDMLDSPDHGERFDALKEISTQNLTEYIPDLILRVEQQPHLVLQQSFINCLDKLEYPDMGAIVYSCLNNIDTFIPAKGFENESKREAKLYLTSVLMHHGDFTQSEIVFDYLENEANKFAIGVCINLLEKIYENYPAYSNEVILQLTDIYNNTNRENYKIRILEFFNQIDYSQIVDLCLDTYHDFNNSADFRVASLKILVDREYTQFRELLRTDLLNESNDYVRFRMFGGLVSNFGEPSDIYLAQSCFNSELSDNKFLMEEILQTFIPLKPNLPTSQIIDSLDSYVEQLFQFGWISDSNTYLEFKEKTDRLRENYEAPNIKEVCWLLIAIIDLATQYHGSSAFTEEAYKFLYYYTGYIKENVETEFGTCP